MTKETHALHKQLQQKYETLYARWQQQTNLLESLLTPMEKRTVREVLTYLEQAFENIPFSRRHTVFAHGTEELGHALLAVAAYTHQAEVFIQLVIEKYDLEEEVKQLNTEPLITPEQKARHLYTVQLQQKMRELLDFTAFTLSDMQRELNQLLNKALPIPTETGWQL